MTDLSWRPRCRRLPRSPLEPSVRDSERQACLRHAPWSVLALHLL